MPRIKNLVIALAAGFAAVALGAGSARAVSVTWMNGFAAPSTPARYDKVGVIKVGPSSARNV
ncbi:MAG: hypothetical protein JO179_03895, partial [Solirubrobacterales bacterium]|nr:hypothetical protein [Solirubrobacterales bacterium]